MLGLDLAYLRINYLKETVHSYEDNGIGGEEQGRGLDGAHELAEECMLRSKWPVVEDQIKYCEGHREQAEEQVRERHVGYQDIPC